MPEPDTTHDAAAVERLARVLHAAYLEAPPSPTSGHPGVTFDSLSQASRDCYRRMARAALEEMAKGPLCPRCRGEGSLTPGAFADCPECGGEGRFPAYADVAAENARLRDYAASLGADGISLRMRADETALRVASLETESDSWRKAHDLLRRRVEDLEADNARLREVVAAKSALLSLRAEKWADDEIERLRAALRPFAYQAGCLDDPMPDTEGEDLRVPDAPPPPVPDSEHFRFRGSYAAVTAGDCRKAREALEER